MRKVKLFEDDSNIGTASVLLHTCPRRGELEEGPSYTLILSVSQLEDGENLLKTKQQQQKTYSNIWEAGSFHSQLFFLNASDSMYMVAGRIRL